MTLVELLVAMVILSLLMTLVAQAVHQVALIMRSTQRVGSDLHSRWSAGWSVSGMLANLVAPPLPAETPAMTGSAEQLIGFSTLSLNQEDAGLAPFELTLAREGAGASAALSASATVLRYRKPSGNGLFAERAGARAGETVARFDEPVEFAYVNGKGQVLGQWHVTQAKAIGSEVLPRSILIRSIKTGRVMMSYPFMGETRLATPPSKPFWEQ